MLCSKTSFTFLCSKDILNITDGMGAMFGFYCGNMTGKNLLVTGDQVKIVFKSDDTVEQRGYRIVFNLVLQQGKWDYKKLIKLFKFTKFISFQNKFQNSNSTTKTKTPVSDFQYSKIGFFKDVRAHSRPRSPRSFWPAAGIDSSGRTRFSEHAQSICFIFLANQICQIWREVRESLTSGVGQSQSYLY